MIDKELRLAAFLARFILRPWRWYFRFASFVERKRSLGRNIEGFVCDQVEVPRSEGGSTIRTRIFKPPASTEPLPVLLYLHGGGYFLGTPETFLPVIRQFIETRPCIVVSPDYRKSLQAPYPAALDDCYDTLLWVRDNAARLGGRADQIMVGGHSAGGGLTAAVSLRARDRGEVNIAFQMPVYPMIDDRMETPSSRNNRAPMWNSRLNALAWSLYLKGTKDEGLPVPYEAAPARATDFSNLPPTMTFVGDLEPFRDETVNYVRNLEAAGVPVEFRLYEGCFHSFDLIAPKAHVSRQASSFAMEAFANAVDQRFALQPK